MSELPLDVFELGNRIALPELYAQCIRSLCDTARIAVFEYPEELKTVASTDDDWLLKSLLIQTLNDEPILKKVGKNVNCYTIHTRHSPEEWRLRYIGQTDPRRATANISRLLIPKMGQGNRVMTLCKGAVRNGAEIGLRLIRVEPDTLRSFIQEKAVNELRTGNILDWNRAGVVRSQGG